LFCHLCGRPRRGPRGCRRTHRFRLGVCAAAPQQVVHRGTQLGGRLDRAHARGLECLVLVGRRALAAGDDGPRMAHAIARRRGDAGNVSHYRLGDEAADELRCRLLIAAADLTHQDDALGTRVALEQLDDVDEVETAHRIAADADTGALPEADVGGLEDRFVGQSTGARDDTDGALLVNEARHDADLAFLRRDDTRTVGADEARRGAGQHRLHPHHVVDGHTFGDADHQLDAGVGRLENGVGRTRRGHVDHAGGGTRLFHRILDRIEHGQAEVLLTAAPGRYAADELRAIGNRLLRMESALFAGEALANDPSVRVDQNAHDRKPLLAGRKRDDLARGICQIGGRSDGEAAVGQRRARLVGIGAFEADDDGHLHAHVLDGVDHAIGDEIAADDAAEDVDQHRANLRIREDELERRGHPLAGRTAADVEEVGRLAAVQLDQIHGRHREARAVDHACDVTVQRDVVELVLAGAALHRIFLGRIAKLCQIRMPEYCVGIDVDFGVERNKLAGFGHDERIHLHEARVLLHVELVQRRGDRLEFRYLRTLETEAEGNLPRLIRLQARRRMHRHGQDLLGRLLRDLLDVHAAGSGGDERDAALLAIESQRQIDLALDLRARLHIDALHRQALGTGLFGLQARSEHRGGGTAHRLRIARQLDAAGLAAATGMYLSLDDPDRPADRVGRRDRLIRAGGDAARRNGDSVIPEYLFSLIFVQIH